LQSRSDTSLLPDATLGGVMRSELSCTFCGKEQQEVKKLVPGPVTYICDGCIDLCAEVIGPEDDD
jgi:ATP-dependent Clp protease ATP-binding subunit ClpX